MNHLHSEGIVHGDLKCGNVLLKAELRPVSDTSSSAAAAAGGTCGPGSVLTSAGPGQTGGTSGYSGRELTPGVGVGSGRRGVVHQEQLVAKVADFGLACRLRDQDTHVSGVHRVSSVAHLDLCPLNVACTDGSWTAAYAVHRTRFGVYVVCLTTICCCCVVVAGHSQPYEPRAAPAWACFTCQ